jgi:hypothetical protein
VKDAQKRGELRSSSGGKRNRKTGKPIFAICADQVRGWLREPVEPLENGLRGLYDALTLFGVMGAPWRRWHIERAVWNPPSASMIRITKRCFIFTRSERPIQVQAVGAISAGSLVQRDT